MIRRLQHWQDKQVRVGPETLHVDVSNACNQRCVTCWNYSPDLTTPKDAHWRRELMPRELFESIIDDAASLDVQGVVISGSGDPLAHPDIVHMIRYAKKKGLRLTVITNGTFRVFPEVLKAGVDRVLLSLHAASAAIYNEYHPGVAHDSFDRLLDIVEYSDCGVNLVTVHAINKINFREIPEMMTLGSRLDARVMYKYAAIPAGCSKYALDDNDLDELVGRLIPLAESISTSTGVKHNLSALKAQSFGARDGKVVCDCFAGHLYSRIYVDGTVFYCCAHIPVGKVGTARFRDIWFSSKYDSIRARIRGRDFFAACNRCGKLDMNLRASAHLGIRLRRDTP